MTCSASTFTVEEFQVTPFPYKSGNLVPGDMVKLYAQVMNGGSNSSCSCAVLRFTVNGAEITTKKICVTAPPWLAWSYVETEATYKIPDYGTYNFCAEIVSVS